MIFKPVELDWAGQTYLIPANCILGAIAIIEEYFTFQDLANVVETKNLSLTKLARTYGDILRYAGATVTNDEVYAGMFAGDMSNKILTAVNTLLMMMIPPSVMAAASGDRQPGNLTASATAKRSGQTTKRLSARAG